MEYRALNVSPARGPGGLSLRGNGSNHNTTYDIRHTTYELRHTNRERGGMADAPGLGPGILRDVEVRILSLAILY
jgi:hypothetical protein